MVLVVSIIIIAVVVFLILVNKFRFKLYFDLDTMTFVCDFYIFSSIHIIKFKAFECNGKLYYQINANDLKEFRQKGKENKSKNKATKLSEHSFSEILQELSQKIKDMPKLKFYDLILHMTVGAGNSGATALVCSSADVILYMLHVASRNKIKAKNFDCSVYPNFQYSNTVLSGNISIGLSFYKLIFWWIGIKKSVKQLRLSKNKI